MDEDRQPSETTGRHGRLSADAFAALYTKSYRLLWCVAAAVVRDRVSAEDVLQEAAMIGLGKLDEFDAGTNFNAWMSRIVRFTAMNVGRKHAHRPASVDPHDVLDSAVPGDRKAGSGFTVAQMVQSGGVAPQASLHSNGQLHAEQQDFDDELRHALDTLDDTARACLLLRTVLDLPYRDIALALDIPEGTAMSHVHRSRRALREMLRADRAPSHGVSTQPPPSLIAGHHGRRDMKEGGGRIP